MCLTVFKQTATIMAMTSEPTSPREFSDLTWQPDRLGSGYECTTFDLPPAPDSGGDGGRSRAVLVRALPDEPTGKPALIWVHGMSDYFFQTHVAEHFTSRGYPFYAIDLRGCGRSGAQDGRFHYITDLTHYFPELTRALDVVADRHGSVVPIAHSTGGLIVPLWADELRRTDPARHGALAGIVLNSPWLDMQFPRPLVAVVRPLVNVLGKRFPTLKLPNIGEGTYGQSISAEAHGEWHFDTDLKPLGGHPKYLGWARAVFQGHKEIHNGIDTGVPTLTLMSSHSYLSKPYSPAADTADTVLDVEQIRRWAPTLSSSTTVEAIDGARHDVFLSERHAREAAFSAADAWLDSLSTAPDTKAEK